MAQLAKLSRVGSNLRMGIVGMANVGKSSTFNMLSKQSVPAENFPFCTIDPNHALVKVADPRFEYLCNLFKPKSQIGTTLRLVKGASEGFGLGNEFLSHIAQVDGLYQVVRAFEKEKIVHTEGAMDPIRDLQIISDELVAKDHQQVSKRLEESTRKLKRYESNKNSSQEARDLIILHQVLEKCDKILKKKEWVRFSTWNDLEVEQLNRLCLLTAKPSLYLINLSEEDFLKVQDKKEIKYQKPIEKWVQGKGKVIYYSVDTDEISQQSLDQIIYAGYELLGLQLYFTVGTDEVRAWTVKKGIKAPQAAAAIHTDFEKNFISAEVMPFDKFKALGDKALDLYQKRFAKEGKDYIVKDGDILHFKIKSQK